MSLASGFFEKTFFRYWKFFSLSDILKPDDFRTEFNLTHFSDCYRGKQSELICQPSAIDVELKNLKEELIFCLSKEKEKLFRRLKKTTGVLNYIEEESEYSTDNPKIKAMREIIVQEGVAMMVTVKQFLD